MWLYNRTTVDLFVDFDVGDLDGRAVSMRKRSHISNPCLSICCVGLEAFTTLVFCVHIFNVLLFGINEISLFQKKKKPS